MKDKHGSSVIMEYKITGWVIANTGHPSTGSKFIVPSTFSYKRKDAIAKFIEGSGNSWLYWKKEYNFCAVKATNCIKTIDNFNLCLDTNILFGK